MKTITALITAMLISFTSTAFAMGEYGPTDEQISQYVSDMGVGGEIQIVKTYPRTVSAGHGGFITAVSTQACEGTVYLTSSVRGLIYGSYASGNCEDTLADVLGSHSFEMLADKLSGGSDTAIADTE